jgi:CRISPR-associated protein Cmr3
MTCRACFIEPLDVLLLRGNKLFGDPGSYGESLVPPWPSVAAGALRSRILADDGVDFAAFARGAVKHPSLGTPQEPGSFTMTAFQLARRFADERGVEVLMPPPADLVIVQTGEDNAPAVGCLAPAEIANGLLSSCALPLLPVLAENERSKPVAGYWLTEAGWKKYLAGVTPAATDLVTSSQLWAIDHRVGVGLDADTRRAADGKLFSVQAVAMIKLGQHIGWIKDKKSDSKPARADYDVGFLAAVAGARLPSGGMLRLGGDGRAAAIHAVDATLAEADYAAIAEAKRCRIVLTTPGIFAQGWQLPGVDAQGRFSLRGVSGRLVCAAVPRAETVSGWDLANRKPKDARRMAPAGSVYWLDELDTTADALRKLAMAGLWSEPCEDTQRRAEGFNHIAIAAY